MIITIDGPSGTGKSTAAQGLATALGISHFDTGALYRSIAWKVLQEGIPFDDDKNLNELLKHFEFHTRSVSGKKRYFVGESDVSDAIRTQEVSDATSLLSTKKIIRDALKPLQINFAKEESAVFEGRDLGTIVFPDADAKFFLTARPEVRAERRLKELVEKFPERIFTFDQVLAATLERDQTDSEREIAPLKQADDAHLIDTSDLTIKQVIEAMKKGVEGR